MSTPPEDMEPARLRAAAFVRAAEDRMRRIWFRSLTRWMDRTRPEVTAGDRVAPENVAQNTAYWGELVDAEVLPEVRSLMDRVRRRVRPAEPEALTDPETAAYLNEAGNRLRRIPDEVYALIVREIETGVAQSEGVPAIRDRVQRVLTATGSEYWPNRAVTVARTEVMGAVNGAAYFAAVRDAAERGDPAPFKVWLATDDQRTRPTHREADGQRTLLTEPFRVGGAALLFPGDPRGPAQEVINCRCSILPVILGETLDWTDRQMRRR